MFLHIMVEHNPNSRKKKKLIFFTMYIMVDLNIFECKYRCNFVLKNANIFQKNINDF
jgi:hypothetical protein